MKLLKFIVQQENQLAQQNFPLLGNMIKKPHAFFLELSNTDHTFAISTSCNKLHETHNVHNIFMYLIKKLIFLYSVDKRHPCIGLHNFRVFTRDISINL